MLVGIEDILCELASEEINGCPPGFRFHPTDEELVSFYLASKLLHGSNSLYSPVDIIIPEVDLNKCEPWELPNEAKMSKREWYFYSLRDRKYPTGLRTNRATTTGYWKATGKDKEIYAAATGNGGVIGVKKTLVFYIGRAPKGEKTKWVMHEYRLHPHFFISCSAGPASSKDEWVICRIYHKAVEKKNMLSCEIGTCSIPRARNESLFQLSGRFIQNQGSAFVAADYRNKPNSTQLLSNNTYNPLLIQSQLDAFFPSYNFQHESSSNNPAIIAAIGSSVNPTTSKLYLMEEEVLAKINNATYTEQVMTESNCFTTQPHLLLMQGKDRGDSEWFHVLQTACPTTQFNPYNAIKNQMTNIDMDLNQGGCCLQMVVDPNFRITTEGDQLSGPLGA